ncbi:MAG: glycoside hydrolase family 68 protein, partial [Sphingomonas sp.]
MTSPWTRDAVAAIADRPIPEVPFIAPHSMPPVLPGQDLWDYWPVQECDGSVADIAGGALQMLLSAPVLPDPESRHALARIRAMHETADGWRDLGDLLPDGLAPGSREWSGSAIVSPDHDRVTLYFTAAGHRGETEPSFDQR